MIKPQFILVACTGASETAASLGCIPAHLFLRTGASGKLICSSPHCPSGGIAVLSAQRDNVPEDADAFISSVENFLKRGRFRGLFADFEEYSPRLSALVPRLESLCRRRDCDFYIPELYAPQSENAFVLVGSDVGAGSYEGYIREQVQRYGSRFVLELIPLRADFALPSGGNAREISKGELDMLLGRGMTPYYAQALCAHYFTYRDKSGATHFTLFDDGASLRRKCEIAARAGVSKIFALYDELENELPDILSL